MEQTSIYLVAIAEAGALGDMRAGGLEDGQTARVLAADGFDALAVDVPTDMFEDDGAEARLKDVRWLTPRAAAHERLVRAAMDRAAVMPVGFGSVFSDERALAASLARHEHDIAAFLGEAAGAREWSVKALADRDAFRQRAREALAATSDVEGGAAYLQRRKQEEDIERLAEELALEALDGLIDGADGTFRDVVERPVNVQPEDGRWLPAHLAFLVGEEERLAFDDAIERGGRALDAAGIDLEVSGPWPPYSFCPRVGEDAGDLTSAEADVVQLEREAV